MEKVKILLVFIISSQKFFILEFYSIGVSFHSQVGGKNGTKTKRFYGGEKNLTRDDNMSIQVVKNPFALPQNCKKIIFWTKKLLLSSMWKCFLATTSEKKMQALNIHHDIFFSSLNA